MNAKTPTPQRYDPLEPPESPMTNVPLPMTRGQRPKVRGQKAPKTAKPADPAVDAKVVAAFALRGIADAQPRENVLTFGAWCQQGRVVRKGEKAVRVGRYNLFHESQTKALDKSLTRPPGTLSHPMGEGRGEGTVAAPIGYRLVMTPGERIRVEMEVPGTQEWNLAVTFAETHSLEARQWVQCVGGRLVGQSIPIAPEEEPDEPAFAAAETFEVPVQVLPMLQPPAPVLPTNIVVLPPPATPPSSWRNRLRRF